MMRTPLKITLAAALLVSLSITSCQKSVDNANQDEEVVQTIEATENDAEAEVSFGDVDDQVMGVDAESGLGQIDLFASANVADNTEENGSVTTDPNNPPGNRCFKITIEPRAAGVYPKTITIDYGTGCTGRDGKKRSGKIITVYSKPLVVPGATATTTFENYKVNDVLVEGKHIIKNNSTSSVLVISRLVVDGKLLKDNGSYIKWNAEHTNTQVAGLGTPGFPRDDEWSITGGARGELSRNGKLVTWSRLITDPLHKAFVCRWIDKGRVRITRNDKVAILDFGNGTCDNKAVISIDGIRKEITLR